MPWELSLENTSYHWMYDFVKNSCFLSSGINYTYSHLNLKEIENAQTFRNLSVSKTFQDKYERSHYFTVDSQLSIEAFLQQQNASHYYLTEITDYNILNRKVVRISLRLTNQFIYCLPRIFVRQRTRLCGL